MLYCAGTAHGSGYNFVPPTAPNRQAARTELPQRSAHPPTITLGPLLIFLPFWSKTNAIFLLPWLSPEISPTSIHGCQSRYGWNRFSGRPGSAAGNSNGTHTEEGEPSRQALKSEQPSHAYIVFGLLLRASMNALSLNTLLTAFRIAALSIRSALSSPEIIVQSLLSPVINRS